MPSYLYETLFNYDQKYIVSGQKLTSYLLNEHASLYFSDKPCYVVRGLDLTYNSNTKTIIVSPGALVVSKVLVTIKDKISIIVPDNQYTLLYVVVMYSPDTCFTVPPTICLITEDELDKNYMTVLGCLKNNSMIDYCERDTTNISLNSLPATQIVTFSFDVTTPQFKILYPGSNFILVDLYLNGVRLIMDTDYVFDSDTKIVTLLNMNSNLNTVSCEIKLLNTVSQYKTILKNSTYMVKFDDSIVNNNSIIDIEGQDFNFLAIDPNRSINVFKNGYYLYESMDYSLDFPNNKIHFSDPLNILDECIISFNSNYLYDNFICSTYRIFNGITAGNMSYIDIPIASELNTYVFKNGILLTPGVDYTMNPSRNRITFTSTLLPYTKYSIISQRLDDITNNQIVNVTSSTNVVNVLYPPLYGFMFVFVNGRLLNPSELNYNYSIIDKKIYFTNSISSGSIIQIFTR